MKLPPVLLFTVLLTVTSHAANILWISDQLPIGSANSDNDGGTEGRFGSGAGAYPDQGVISLLTGAGHTVARYNPANNTPISAGDVATMNSTYDLLIIGKSINSGAFDAATETLPWNTLITKPLMVTNTFINRGNRLGWYTGSTQPDVVANNLTFINPANPVSAFIIGNVPLSGSTTVNSATEAVTYPDLAIDTRGTSLITDPLVTGGTQIASSTGAANSTFIGTWPAGTVLSGTSSGQVLSGFRMQYLLGNREATAAPNNTVGSAGFENLTPDGEAMFLRSVTVAVNNGAIPEPGSASMLALAAVGLLQRRRRSSLVPVQ